MDIIGINWAIIWYNIYKLRISVFEIIQRGYHLRTYIISLGNIKVVRVSLEFIWVSLGFIEDSIGIKWG